MLERQLPIDMNEQRLEQIRQIVKDCLLARADGEAVTDESLIHSHPELMPELAEELRNLQMIEQADRQADRPGSSGLHIRCPHCQNPVELVDESSLSEVVCPSCGSQFSLVDDSDQTYQARSDQTIGHFQLLDKVGMGAFGSVWSARDTELDRQVAIKIPRKGQLSAEDAELFIREARAAAQLKHPHIVSVLEVGRHEDRIYIVTEFVQGLDLADWLTDQQATPREAAELCATVADALQHAHEQGVIHRDLKPSNIMLDTDGKPHLMDFGLAKRESGEMTMTVEGKLLGTPAYMSPEQARGSAHNADARTDVYSLGVILFEVLTGERPFRGSTRMLLHQILVEDAPSPRKLSSAVPRDLDTICLKCLEKDPYRRYRTAGELRDDLQRFLNREPVLARPITKVARAWRWCKRKPVVAGLGAAVVCLLLVLGFAGPIVATHQASLRLAAERAAERETRAHENTKAAEERALETAESLRNSVYASDMRAAQIALAHSNYAQANHLLRKYLPEPDREDLRGFEWRYLWKRLQGNATHTWHTDHYVNGIQWSPTGEFLLNGSANKGFTEIRSAHDGHLVHRWTHATCFANIGLCPSFSPDGKSVALASPGKVQFLNPETGQLIREITLPKKEGEPELSKVVFSPDGRLLAVNTLSDIHIVDLESDSITTAIQTSTDLSRQLSFTPEGNGLIFYNYRSRELVWFDLETQKVAKRFPLPEGSVPRFWDIAARRQLLASVSFTSERQGHVIVWDLNGKQLWVREKIHSSAVVGITFSTDETRIATVSFDQTINVLDAPSGQIQTTLHGHQNEVWGIAAAPDGSGLVSASKDGTIRRWPWQPAREDSTYVISDSRAISVTNHGRLATRNRKSGEIRFWDEYGNSTPLQPEIPDDAFRKRGHLQMTNSGRIFLDQAGILHLFDPEKETWIRTIDSADSPYPKKHIVAPDGRHMAIIRRHNERTDPTFDVNLSEVELINLQQNEVLLKRPGVSGMEYWERTQVAFSSNGKLLAFPTESHRILIWDIHAGRTLHELDAPKWHLNCLRFAPSNRLLAAGGWEGTVWLWDVNTGHLVVPPIQGHGSGVRSVHFTHDERTILTYGDDYTMRAWSTASGQEMLKIRTPHMLVESQAILAKDSLLVFETKDGLSVEYIPTLDAIQMEGRL